MLLAKKRLLQEIQQWERKEDGEDLQARPIDPERSMLNWMFVFRGPEGTPYEGGCYVGTVDLPPTYPLRPPCVKMLTPSGRFQTGVSLCLNFTEYHPESWNPAWTIQSMLRGLVSFMTDEVEQQLVGGLNTGPEEKKRSAEMSHEFNESIPSFSKLFPEFRSKVRRGGGGGKRQRT